MNIACKNLVNENNAIKVQQAFNALASPTRLKIIYIISTSELSVMDITKQVGLNQSTVSQQLAKLCNSNIVKRRREKNYVMYSLHDERVLEMLELLTVE